MNNETMELLKRHFDTAFVAPDGIKKLRELILTLAMQGKLVPQDPKDQPASELLKEIVAEKQRLVKTGKIKKPKPLPQIKPEEAPYELPQGWEWARLGDLGNAQTGTTPPSKDRENYGDYISFIGPGDIKNGIINYSGEGLSERGLSNGRLIDANSVLMVCIGGSIGKHAINEIDTTCNQQINTLTPYGPILIKYVYNAMAAVYFQKDVINQATGSATPIINKQKWSAILIPLPPLPEQHRIVTKIDQLMARCDELEKLRAEQEQKRLAVHTAVLKQLLDAQEQDSFTNAWQFIIRHFGELYTVKENVTELRKAILQLAVMGKLVPQDPNDPHACELLIEIEAEKQRLMKAGKIKKPNPLPPIKPEDVPYQLPQGWDWVRLGDILVFGPTNGFSPRAVEYETNVRSLTLSATTSGVFKEEHAKFIANNIPLNSDLWLRDGDILVQRGNTIEYVGVSAVYRGKPNRFIYPDLMMRIRVASAVDINYVHRAMSSVICREYLRSRASGTSSTMPKINQTTLRSLPLPLPPLCEQHRIVDKVDQLMGLCDSLDNEIDVATSKQTELLNSLMAQA